VIAGGRITLWIKRRPLVSYFVLVFGLSWLLFLTLQSAVPPLVALFIGSWLPNFAGVLVTGLASGRRGLRTLLRRAVRWQVGFKWYAIAWFVPMSVTLLAIGAYRLTGQPMPEAAPASALPLLLAVNIVLGPLGEELGWRGTALPLMQNTWNVLTAGLVLGVVWGLYHLPAFLIPGLPQQNLPLPAFIAGAVALNIFMAWMFDHTRGSLIMPFLAHLAFNFTGSATGVYAIPALLWLIAGLWWIVCAAIIVLDRIRLTRRASTLSRGIWE
jgi:membrane protease YdiL (CAAX protease family)